MDGNRKDEIRRRATRISKDASRPEGKDRAHSTQAERDVEAARNPVGNGQGDAQADDPRNEMHSPHGTAEDVRWTKSTN